MYSRLTPWPEASEPGVGGFAPHFLQNGCLVPHICISYCVANIVMYVHFISIEFYISSEPVTYGHRITLGGGVTTAKISFHTLHLKMDGLKYEFLQTPLALVTYYQHSSTPSWATQRGSGVPLSSLFFIPCPFISSLALLTFSLLSFLSTLRIFFFCPSLPFLPE